MHTLNILNCYLAASDEHVAEGMHWYDSARDLARSLSPDDVWRAAGVIAAFSPICPWHRTEQLAINAFATGRATGHTKQNCNNAQRIMSGEHPLEVLKGNKTRAFASAIADPNSRIATIDRHAHDIAMGRVYSDKERKIGKAVFRTLSDAYREAADYAGISVNAMQAITWVSWRARKQ